MCPNLNMKWGKIDLKCREIDLRRGGIELKDPASRVTLEPQMSQMHADDLLPYSDRMNFRRTGKVGANASLSDQASFLPRLCGQKRIKPARRTKPNPTAKNTNEIQNGEKIDPANR